MSKTNIAPKYLRKTKQGHWYFFKLKDGFRGYGYHTKLGDTDIRVIPIGNGYERCVYDFNLSYFRTVPKGFIKKRIKQAEGKE